MTNIEKPKNCGKETVTDFGNRFLTSPNDG